MVNQRLPANWIYTLNKTIYMKTFSQVQKLNEMKYGQPLYDEKDLMKNRLITAAGNDVRVLNDIIACLTDAQMEKCYDKLIKEYSLTGKVGEAIPNK